MRYPPYPFCIRSALGARHADNVGRCIFGGFTVVRSTDPLDIVSIDFPPLFATVIHPQIEIQTADARAILPKHVPLTDAIKQWSNLAALVSTLSKGDLNLLARSMEDFIVEPVRKSLIPKFDEVREASMASGAIDGGISGSRPSMFMLSDSLDAAESGRTAVQAVYAQAPIEFNIHVCEISPNGVKQA